MGTRQRGSAHSHLVGGSCHGCGMVNSVTQCDGQAQILLDVFQVEIRLEVPLENVCRGSQYQKRYHLPNWQDPVPGGPTPQASRLVLWTQNPLCL